MKKYLLNTIIMLELIKIKYTLPYYNKILA